jgi:hypothetical protein
MRVLSFLDVDRVCRSLSDRIVEVTGLPLVDGQLFEEVDATTAGTSVVHGLGRTPKGAIVVRADTAATYVLDEFNKTSFDITSSAASTVNLWVF